MIRIRGLTLARGTKILLESADATISPGERIALIGDNGSGKSTLLSALAGELAPDAGEIVMPAWQIARLDQRLPRSEASAWRFVVEGDQGLATARQALQAAEEANDGDAIAQAHEALLQAGASSAEARAREVLNGLGFDSAQQEQTVDTFSGGWKMRLNLARVLMSAADLLLLDEPTNHLDLDAVLWLERRLLRLAATVIVVSHDRDFLDRVAGATLQVENRCLQRYAGGYSACEQARAERAQQRERQWAAQQTRMEALNAFVTRFRAKASKARQAQSRLKAIERMELLAPLRATRAVDFEFPPVGETSDPFLHVQGLDAGYPAREGESNARVILRDIRLTVGRGTRLGVLGRNGMGKTTLIRTLIGELPPLSGERALSRGIRVGYFAQQQIDGLRADDSPLQHLQRSAPEAREQTLRDWVGRFGFRGEDAVRPLGPMSGGEKARVALATLVWLRPQWLVLDEPTNHLDAQTRDVLAEAIAAFDGALLLVSHDRYLLRSTVDQFIQVRDGRVLPFEGDLEDYAQSLLRSDTPEAVTTGAAREETSASRRDQRRVEAGLRAQRAAQRKPLTTRMAAVEAALVQIERRQTDLDAQLADPRTYAASETGAALARERHALQVERDALESEWLELGTALEQLDAGEAQGMAE